MDVFELEIAYWGLEVAGRRVTHGPDDHGPGAAMGACRPRYRIHEPGAGLRSTPQHRVLVYDDWRAQAPRPDRRPPAQEVELYLTGKTEPYTWSFDGRGFTEVDGPIHFRHGERLRLIIDETTMDTPSTSTACGWSWSTLQGGCARASTPWCSSRGRSSRP